MDVPTLHSFHLHQHVRSLCTYEFAKHKGKKEKKKERKTNEQQPDTYLYGFSILRYVTASAEKECISDPPGMKSRTEINLL